MKAREIALNANAGKAQRLELQRGGHVINHRAHPAGHVRGWRIDRMEIRAEPFVLWQQLHQVTAVNRIGQNEARLADDAMAPHRQIAEDIAIIGSEDGSQHDLPLLTIAFPRQHGALRFVRVDTAGQTIEIRRGFDFASCFLYTVLLIAADLTCKFTRKKNRIGNPVELFSIFPFHCARYDFPKT